MIVLWNLIYCLRNLFAKTACTTFVDIIKHRSRTCHSIKGNTPFAWWLQNYVVATKNFARSIRAPISKLTCRNHDVKYIWKERKLKRVISKSSRNLHLKIHYALFCQIKKEKQSVFCLEIMCHSGTIVFIKNIIISANIQCKSVSGPFDHFILSHHPAP